MLLDYLPFPQVAFSPRTWTSSTFSPFFGGDKAKAGQYEGRAMVGIVISLVYFWKISPCLLSQSAKLEVIIEPSNKIHTFLKAKSQEISEARFIYFKVIKVISFSLSHYTNILNFIFQPETIFNHFKNVNSISYIL